MDTSYSFADAQFDPKLGVLTRAGKSATLRPRAAAVLICLLEQPRELVTKDDLLRKVWTDLVVTENSLSQCVREIRRELGDAEERLLRTIPRRGYLLDAAVTRIRPPAPPAPAARRAIIVLPLVSIGGDPEQDYFAEGLTEDLTIDVGRMPGVFVIGRGTAQTFAGRAADPRDIGRELGVNYVIDGSVRRGESRIVVILRVTETEQGRQVWSERFETGREDLLSLQRSMAAKVAHMLHFDLASVETRQLERMEPREMDAQDLVTRAFSMWHRVAPAMSDEALDLIRRAIEVDPGCGAAWAMLAQWNIMALASRNFSDWDGTVAAAEAAARKALAVEPDNRIAHGALGAALAYQGRFEEALAALGRQMAINPNLASAQQWTGIVHILMGNASLAVRPLETAIELSPRDSRLSTFIRNLALAHLHLEDDARGLILAERSVHQPRPWPRSYETLAAACAVNGLMEEARAAVTALLRHWPGYSIARHKAEMMSTRPAFVAQRERLLEALRKAGLPEK